MTEATRLYLITPPIADAAAFRPALEAALAAADAACILLRVVDPDMRNVGRVLQALAPLAQAKGAAALIDPPSDWREVARLGADGVHLLDSRVAKEALQALKPDRIVGAGGLRSRDSAMEAGEAGADYVMFGEPRADGSLPPPAQVIERCSWWAEVFTTPCVGYAASPEAVADISATGVEFVALGDWAFAGSPEEVAERLRIAAGLLAA